MSVAPLACPYCNARLSPAAGPRQTCASCGETFAARRQQPEAIQAPSAVTTAAAALPAPPPETLRGHNRRVLGVVLASMAVLAAAGLSLALYTVDTRRGHDRSLPRRVRRPYQLFVDPTPEPGEVVSPPRLAALGYLPPQTNLIVAAHVAELRASPAWEALRGQSLSLGRFQLGLETLRERAGLNADEIDHLAVGAVLRPGEPLRVYVVLRTLRARDPARLRAALGAGRALQEKTPDGGSREVHETAAPLAGVLWRADAHTVVLGLGVVGGLGDVPIRPRDGVAGLPDEVAAAVKTRVGAAAPLWAVGHSPDWGKTILPPLAARIGVPGLARLDRVRTFALSVWPERPIVLQGAFRCADGAAAERLWAEEFAARARAGAVKGERHGDWLSFQWTTTIGANGGAP